MQQICCVFTLFSAILTHGGTYNLHHDGTHGLPMTLGPLLHHGGLHHGGLPVTHGLLLHHGGTHGLLQYHPCSAALMHMPSTAPSPLCAIKGICLCSACSALHHTAAGPAAYDCYNYPP